MGRVEGEAEQEQQQPDLVHPDQGEDVHPDQGGDVYPDQGGDVFLKAA